MNSAADKSLIYDLAGREEHFQRWMEHPSSVIIHHDSACCEEARLWFLARAHSMEIGSLSQFRLNAPTWLMNDYEWGVSKWPIAWCEVVKEKMIDCGAFAALTREVFAAQGHEAHPAQVLVRYNESCTTHWKDLWKKGQDSISKSKEFFPWVGSEMIYHEICALELPDGTARFFDSTFGFWYEPMQRYGFGALLAVRAECPRILRWGEKTISCGEWTEL